MAVADPGDGESSEGTSGKAAITEDPFTIPSNAETSSARLYLGCLSLSPAVAKPHLAPRPSALPTALPVPVPVVTVDDSASSSWGALNGHSALPQCQPVFASTAKPPVMVPLAMAMIPGPSMPCTPPPSLPARDLIDGLVSGPLDFMLRTGNDSPSPSDDAMSVASGAPPSMHRSPPAWPQDLNRSDDEDDYGPEWFQFFNKATSPAGRASPAA
jgi:hypothetical protein